MEEKMDEELKIDRWRSKEKRGGKGKRMEVKTVASTSNNKLQL